MPSDLHNRLVEQLRCMGLNTPGTRPTLRETIARETGAPLTAMRREHVQVPIPDAWAVLPEFRTVFCVEVDITHRARLGKYADLWWWLDADDWRLYVVRVNHEGVFWPVDLFQWVHREDKDARHNPIPHVDRDRYDEIAMRFGIRLTWPVFNVPEEAVEIRRKQPDGSWLTLKSAPDAGELKSRSNDKITMPLYYGDEEPPP